MKVSLIDFIEEYGELFQEYNEVHGAWGSLHIVLDDGNMSKRDIESCVKFAREKEDWKGLILAQTLLLLSETQVKELYDNGIYYYINLVNEKRKKEWIIDEF